MTVTGQLTGRQLSYAPVGSTRPGDQEWAPPPGWRAYERSVVVGRGQQEWQRAAALLLQWGVKTRSGFRIEPDTAAGTRVVEGGDYWLVASVGPVAVREPARVVAVVAEPNRCGFAYGTLVGHPVSGEEAFVLHRTAEDDVVLTLRSITRSSPGRWRLLFPLILLAQRWYRSRYVRALLPTG